MGTSRQPRFIFDRRRTVDVPLSRPQFLVIVDYFPSLNRLGGMADHTGLGVDVASDKVLPTNGGPRRLPSFFDDQEPHAVHATSPYSVHDRPFQRRKTESVVESRHAGPSPELVLGGAVMPIHPYSASSISDSGFSRHDSLFSFGVPPARNSAELKSLLGNSSSRLRPGATVLPHHAQTMDGSVQPAHTVSLERAKPRARVEVDIVLESDCCTAGGYLRGHVKLHVRKRQKKEAPVLLADGRVRVIGFECIPSERDYHTFYQRASTLTAITDAYARIYDSPPDAEGFSRAMEGVHVLPFAMHLSEDATFGSAKGAINIQSGVALRYIAMISVKIKDSQTLKRSIAHFYRDCEVWPRLTLDVVLASGSRPIQASTAKSLSVIGGGGQLKLTAMLHRLTWIAGQRCYVRIWLGNDTKKTVKTVVLTLVRTTTLFKHRPVVESDDSQSSDGDSYQTTTTHKVVAESHLERSHPASKHHASTEGWWTGVRAGEDAYFAHHVLIPPDALSVSRSRLIEVEYSIRVTASAGALAPDAHVTLPLRIINFLSVDPTPSDPLLSLDGSYTRLIPLDHSTCSRSPTVHRDTDHTVQYTLSEVSTISIDRRSGSPSMSPLSGYHPSTPTQATPARAAVLDPLSGNVQVSEPSLTLADPQGQEATTSMYSTDSYTSSASPASAIVFDHTATHFPTRVLGNLELHDDADSDEEIASVVDAAQGGRFSARTHSTTMDVYARHSQGHSLSKTTNSPQFTQMSRRHPPVTTFATSPSTIVRGTPMYRELRLEEPAGSLVPRINLVDHEDTDIEESTTPTLRPSTVSSAMSALKPRSSNSYLPSGILDGSHHSGSPQRRLPSRSLPRPPLQPQPTSDIPASVSALEALRLSRLESSRPVNPGSHSATKAAGLSSPAVRTTSSKGPRSTIAQRSPPIPRTRPVSASSTDVPGSNGSPPSSSPMPRGRPGAVPTSTSGSTLRARPADKAHGTGRTLSSVVMGRITAYEQRLRSSIDSSAGYA